jgi:hypothetical protein
VRTAGTLVRKVDGKPRRFGFTLIAKESQFYEYMAISISRRQGGGEHPRMKESHLWSMFLEQGAVVITEDLKSAAIDTGDQLKGWGRIQLEFNSTGPKREGCDPSVNKRPGKLTEPPGGGINFKTKNAVFGAIKSVPLKAFASDGDCQETLRRGPSCPPNTRFVEGSGNAGSAEMNLYSAKFSGAENAYLSVSLQRDASVNRRFSVLVDGGVPGHSLRVQDDLHPAVVEVPKHTPYLSGKASLADPEPADPPDDTPCGSGQEYRDTQRSGSIGGAISMKVTGLPKATFDASLTSGYFIAHKRVVGPAL